MARRILALWLVSLATDRAFAGETRPALLHHGVRGVMLVAAVNRAAALAGLAPGQTLADARAMEPGVRVAPADPEADARLLDRIAEDCGRFTPWVGIDPPDGLFLDITGCAHLFGGESGLRTAVLGRLARLGFAARASVADTAGAAWAVARFGAAARAESIIPPGGARAALAPLPVAALRIGLAEAQGLVRLGLRRIGDLYALPRAGLGARFDQAVLRRLDQALGLLDEPITPRRPVAAHAVRLDFPEPAAGREGLEQAVGRLVDRLCAHLEAAGRGARRLELVGYRCDGAVSRLAIGTSRASRDRPALKRLFAEALDRFDLSPGLDVLVLEAPSVEPLDAMQTGFEGGVGGLDSSGAAELGALIDRLELRLGAGRVIRLAPRDSHWPERAMAPAAPFAPPANPPHPANRPAVPPGAAARPVRLLPRPEPIEATAPVPDDPPLLFRWRGGVHRIGRAEGPERLAPEWWLDPMRDTDAEDLRDYYRLEDRDGRRFWVFRAGLWRPGWTPRWFLHGFFA